MATDTQRRLGRGLEALMSAASQSATTSTLTKAIPVGEIRPNPLQPRQDFDSEELVALEASLRMNGLLQPITVRPAPGGFELIAGERRLRAAIKLGWSEIPAVVREVDDRTLLTLALVENLQRADLNPLEEAEGYKRLVEEFGVTQGEVAEVVGKDRVTVSNALRLLNLPKGVRDMIARGDITPGHGRPLLGLPDESQMLALAIETLNAHLSVREVERRVMQAAPERRRSRKRQKLEAPPETSHMEIRRIEDELRAHLQTDVRLHLTGDETGTLSISFYSSEDLERLLERIGARSEGL